MGLLRWERDKDLVGQTGGSERVTVGLGASDSVCAHSPLCPMLREKENQLLVMVSTAMPGISSQLELCLVCWWLVEMPGAAPGLLGACLWCGLPCSPQCAPSLSAVLSWLCSLQEDDESSQCSADFDLSLPDNGFMSKNEVIRSKVSRLTERLRKRYPSNNFGEFGSRCCWGAQQPGICAASSGDPRTGRGCVVLARLC